MKYQIAPLNKTTIKSISIIFQLNYHAVILENHTSAAILQTLY